MKKDETFDHESFIHVERFFPVLNRSLKYGSGFIDETQFPIFSQFNKEMMNLVIGDDLLWDKVAAIRQLQHLFTLKSSKKKWSLSLREDKGIQNLNIKPSNKTMNSIDFSLSLTASISHNTTPNLIGFASLDNELIECVNSKCFTRACYGTFQITQHQE